MADTSHATNGPSPLSAEGYDASLLPDFDREFLSDEHLNAFASALSAPDFSPSTDDLTGSTNGGGTPLTATSRTSFDASRSKLNLGNANSSQQSLFITAQNDWAPVNTPVGRRGRSRRKKEKKRGKPPQRSKDETREGHLYTLLKWPLLAMVGAWIGGLGLSYMFTRLYIWLYEHFIAWRGKREQLRRKLHATTNYGDWVEAAKELDTFLGNDRWKAEDEYAYYDHKTVRRVLVQIRKQRRKAEEAVYTGGHDASSDPKPIEELKALIEACVKNNFVGVENSRLYSQTYYGTKNLVQEFIDEGEALPKR